MRDQDEESRTRSSSPLRLLKLARSQTWQLVAATVFLFISSLSQVAFPKLAGDLIDISIHQSQKTFNPKAALNEINQVLIQATCLILVASISGCIRSLLFQSVAERIMFNLRVDLFHSLIYQDIGFYDKVRVGELTNRIAEDVRMIKGVATTSLSMALTSMTITITGIAMMFLTSWKLSILTSIIIPIVSGLYITYGRLSRELIKAQLAASAEATTIAEESFSSIRTVRSFAKEMAMEDKYKESQKRALDHGIKYSVISAIFSSVNGAVSTAGIMLVIWFGAREVIHGALTPGKLSSFIVYSMYVGGNSGALFGVFSSVVSSMGAGERVFELLDTVPAIQVEDKNSNAVPSASPDKKNFLSLPAFFRNGCSTVTSSSDVETTTAPLLKDPPDIPTEYVGGSGGAEVVLSNIWFAYPSRPSTWVLQDLSLSIPRGKKVALVGGSGNGKSTIISLIQRFYDPQRGTVSLDGLPLPAIDHAYLHRAVALVAQEPTLFADSIANNIAYGCNRSELTQDATERVARLANAHDFIVSFPQKYDTTVGEKGVRLSGGQKQRIAIARALAVDPKVLLLDEATSALDAESEHLVNEALDRASRGRSVLIVAHRLSTVQNADVVAVVSEGKIVEQGTHEQLLEKEGAYAALVHRQLLGG